MQGEGKQIERFTEEGIRTASFPKGEYVELVPGECDDMQAVVNMGLETIKGVKLRKGQEPKYSPDEEGLNSFLERCEAYFTRIAEINGSIESKHGVVADIEGLTNFLGVTRRTLRRYRERSEAWAYAVDMVEQTILSCKKQMLLTGQVPTVAAIFDLTNNHGYLSTSEFHRTDEALSIVEDAGQRAKRLADKYRISNIPDKLSEG